MGKRAPRKTKKEKNRFEHVQEGQLLTLQAALERYGVTNVTLLPKAKRS